MTNIDEGFFMQSDRAEEKKENEIDPTLKQQLEVLHRFFSSDPWLNLGMQWAPKVIEHITLINIEVCRLVIEYLDEFKDKAWSPSGFEPLLVACRKPYFLFDPNRERYDVFFHVFDYFSNDNHGTRVDRREMNPRSTVLIDKIHAEIHVDATSGDYFKKILDLWFQAINMVEKRKEAMEFLTDVAGIFHRGVGNPKKIIAEMEILSKELESGRHAYLLCKNPDNHYVFIHPAVKDYFIYLVDKREINDLVEEGAIDDIDLNDLNNLKNEEKLYKKMASDEKVYSGPPGGPRP
jgi:hypothetical protein